MFGIFGTPNLAGWKAQSPLEPPRGEEPKTPGSGIWHPNY